MPVLRQRDSRANTGFSLTELLIVLGVLSLLLAMVVPAASRLAALSRRAQCAANLSHIANAYFTRKGHDQISTDAPFSVLSEWYLQLIPFLAANDLALACPEDDDPAAALPDIKMLVRGMSLNPFSTDPIWNEVSGANMPGGYRVWKVSQEQYAGLQGIIGEGHNIQAQLPQYDPGNDPNKYYFLFEDAGDWDYEDVVMEVEEDHGTNKLKISLNFGYTVFSYTMTGPNDFEVDLGTNGSGHPGGFVFAMVGKLSYAMNWRADRILTGTHRILALDYEDYIAFTGASQTEHWETFKAPRHLGECNVAFADGAVESMRLDEIDPTVIENRLKYWTPPGDTN